MHQVFLDANTYLSFYNLTSSDVEQLTKLVELIRLKKLTLLLPAQVADEVRRNRARVVAERLKPLRDARLQVSIPQLAEKTDAAEALRKCAADTQRAHTALLAELTKSAQQGALPADLLIARLFRAASILAHPSALAAAQQRKALGNPPGKGASLGDGVNWETLLVHAAHAADLYFVSADSDFASPLNADAFDEFLADEWWRAKASTVHFYRDIKVLLDDIFPHIRIASDVRKYFLLDALVSSTNFSDTHSTVAALEHYDSFSADEAARLLTGAMDNTQVRWLAQDDDVNALLRRVIAPHRAALPAMLVARWDYLLDGRGFVYGPVPSEKAMAPPPQLAAE